LIGTRSIEHNQIISNFLNRKGITHQVLNAKNHEKEAFIIADAGKKDAITVATNIAGRGVDIVLGGAKPEHKDFRNKPKAYEAALAKWQKAHDQVVTLGGLHIIGSERHESRRIDNQLRGRSGRQGDPGSTQFFLALEDEIMRLFGGNQIAKLMDFLKIEEDQPIEHGMVSKAIESAQVKVEGFFFDQRKRLVEFDDVMNKQREVIYKRRLRILKQSTDEIATLEEKPAKGRGKTSTTTTPSSLSPEQTLRDMVITAIESEIRSVVTARASDSFSSDELDAIVRAFVTIIPFDTASQHELRRGLESLGESNAVMNRLTEIAIQTYQSREDAVSAVHMRNIERTCLLTAIDEQWMDHLDEMDALREGIWLRGDKQMVLSEYKKESYVMFERLIEAIDHTIATRIFRIHVQDEHTLAPATTQAVELKAEEYTNLNEVVAQSPEQHVGSTQKSTPSSTKGSIQDLAAALSGAHAQRAPSPGSAVAKVGRNDPCPCGSGKKFKKCHGKNL
jgi:preprotein translocase subunit SecA